MDSLTTVQLLDNIRSDAKDAISGIVQTIKEIAPQALEMARAKVIAEGFVSLLPCVFLILLLIEWGVVAKYKNGHWYQDKTEGYVGKTLFHLLNAAVCVGVMIACIICIGEAIRCFVATDYLAVQALLNIGKVR